MAESREIEQVFEKLADILTTHQLEKIAQLFLAKSSELMSNTRDTKETKTILGNLVNLAHPSKGKRSRVSQYHRGVASRPDFCNVHAITSRGMIITCLKRLLNFEKKTRWRRTPTMPTLTYAFHQCTKLFCGVMQSILAAGALAVMVTDADEFTPRSPLFEPLCSAAALQLVWSLLGIFDVLLDLHPSQFGRRLAALLNAIGDASLMKVIWAATWTATTLSQDMMLSSDDLMTFEVVMAMARASLSGQLTLLIQSLVNN